MIPTTIKTDQISQQSQNKAVTPAKSVAPVTPITAIADSKDNSHEFLPGQKYQALVEGRLPNGNSSVLISDKILQMNLPGHIQPGDKMELVLLTNEPRLKFALQNENTVDITKNNTLISSTGRFLDVLIQKTEKSPALLTKSTPLVSGYPINNHELPLLLQKAIRQSGLFYESHLAKWINGKHALKELQQEPQGLIKTATSTATSSSSTVPVNTQSLSLVQQQLAALETNHIVWNGEIWNGQQIQWDIYEDNAMRKDGDGNATSQWKTKLTLTLPELGKITISIALNFQDIKISMNTGINQTAQLLQTNQTHLKKRMQTTGLSVQSLDIKYSD